MWMLDWSSLEASPKFLKSIQPPPPHPHNIIVPGAAIPYHTSTLHTPRTIPLFFSSQVCFRPNDVGPSPGCTLPWQRLAEPSECCGPTNLCNRQNTKRYHQVVFWHPRLPRRTPLNTQPGTPGSQYRQEGWGLVWSGVCRPSFTTSGSQCTRQRQFTQQCSCLCVPGRAVLSSTAPGPTRVGGGSVCII